PNLLPEFVNSTIDLLGIPILTFFTKISRNDARTTIAQATTLPESENSPLIIAAVLDRIRAKDLAPPPLDKCWYFEAGAAAQNILLATATMHYGAGIAQPRNYEQLSSALQLNNNQIPLLFIPINTQS
ncbi:MAG: nitroreductase family protein, partial [Candidatus Thermoplasmatota archaeon]|nr:nitroreductase family protein [Candidatus Thermoplasmatota archaeon]